MNRLRRISLKTVNLLAVGLLVIAHGPASAGSVGITPLRLEFDQETRNTMVTITNAGDDELSMQVQAMAWFQGDTGEDQFDSSDDLIVVPPIFSVAPGERQIIRVGTIKPPPVDREGAYRLFFTELPSESSTVRSDSMALKMRMRVTLPVFIDPALGVQPRVDLIETVHDGEKLNVVLSNTGNVHVRVAEIAALGMTAADVVTEKDVSYLLPGTSRNFQLEVPADFSVQRITAVTDSAGTLEYDVASTP